MATIWSMLNMYMAFSKYPKMCSVSTKAGEHGSTVSLTHALMTSRGHYCLSPQSLLRSTAAKHFSL